MLKHIPHLMKPFQLLPGFLPAQKDSAPAFKRLLDVDIKKQKSAIKNQK